MDELLGLRSLFHWKRFFLVLFILLSRGSLLFPHVPTTEVVLFALATNL